MANIHTCDPESCLWPQHGTTSDASAYPKSFDTFRKSTPIWSKHDSFALEFTQARLSLHHPLRPDPPPALQLLKMHENPDWHSWLTKRFDPAGQGSSSLGWMFLVETAQLLARTGRLDDAKWVLDLGIDILPLRFQMKRSKDGSTINANRRLPTPDEAAAGLVDSNGYYLSLVERTSAYANGAAANIWLPDRCASDSPLTDQ